MMWLRRLVVTFFGLGSLPGPTGTYGSFGAAMVFVLLTYVLGYSSLVTIWWAVAALSVVAIVVGIGLGRWATAFYQRSDPSEFVLDEVAGMWVSLLGIPFFDFKGMCWVVAVQFFLFRIADIIKPSPARRSERLPAGWGIMTDDIIAAIYTNLAGQIIFRTILSG